MRMSELLNEVRRFELDEGFSPREIKMAIGIASDPRYAKGNMTGAVNAIEKMKRGLSKHPQVAAVLKRQNENLDEMVMKYVLINMQGKVQGYASDKKDALDIAKRTKSTMHPIKKKITDKTLEKMNALAKTPKELQDLGIIDEAVSPAQQAAIAISKKERGEKPKDEKDEGNTFGKELKAARDKGEKTFVVSGKKYNVEDYDVKEEITEKFSDGMIDKLRKAYEPLRGKKIPPGPLMKIFDKIDSNKAGLEQLYKADIPFVSVMAMSRLMLKHNYKATDINKLGKIRKEEFELDEATYRVEVDGGGVETVNARTPNEAEAKALRKMGLRGTKGKTYGPKVKVQKIKEETLDEAMYHHVLKGKVVASGSKSDMMKLVKKNGATIHKGPDSNYVLNSPGAKVGDIKEETLDEEISINELKMNDPKLIKVFDKLKAKDTVKIKSSSTISQGKDFIEYQVKTKNTLRNGVEKITLMLKGNPTGKNRFLYKKDGKVTFAIGDLGASIDDIKEMAYKPGSFKDTRPQEKAAKALADLAKTGGMDKKDFEKARALYVQASDPASREKLKKFIFNLDTEPKEEIMDKIGRNDPKTFLQMYPDAKEGEPLTRTAFKHRSMKSEAYKPVKSNHYDVKIQGVKKKDVNAILKYIKVDGGNYDIEDVDDDQVRGGGMSSTSDGDIFIQGDDAGKLGMEIAKKFRGVKVMGEEVELGEKYDLYHKDFSSAMQHAYDYAKKKMGITVDPKEIDSKVATGPKKPTEGKTNKYRLKGKGGNLQIQVYNKGGSKPFELNMYKEGADPSVSLYADQITLNAIKEK